MPIAVCHQCQTELKPKEIGVIVFEMAGEKHEAQDYKIWHADLYACPGCGHEVVLRFADKPVAQHFEENFTQKKEAIQISGAHIIWDYERA